MEDLRDCTSQYRPTGTSQPLVRSNFYAFHWIVHESVEGYATEEGSLDRICSPLYPRNETAVAVAYKSSNTAILDSLISGKQQRLKMVYMSGSYPLAPTKAKMTDKKLWSASGR